jgi:hypothetical protein
MDTKNLLQFIKAHDRTLAIIFGLLSLLLIVIAFAMPSVMDWIFARHENVLSWYIRPLFLIPFCLFAYWHSFTGISVTVFCLLTSMFWFPQPTETTVMVQEFLEFEKDYLLGEWTFAKILMSLLVPLTMGLLAYSFWQRNIWLGFSTMAVIAVLKSLWSVFFAGESGFAVIVPAVLGLLACTIFVYLGIRLKKSRELAPQGG